MEKIFDCFKWLVITLATGVTWMFGAWDTPLRILILLMILDYISGVLKGYINKELSSDIGFKGIARKAMIFFILILAVMLDRLLNTGTWIFRTITCYFYIANEGISLLENGVVLGVPVPDKLKDALIQLREIKK
ncbi:TPA: phage holin family protein [Clostridium perfringens]|uniref:phage holin family protein n=1 Tax=Clostridium perfringens TaxID=1502 RepID=UPI0010E3C086|nr:phage holin family protein [Clostridium perfringens]EJT5912977.1 phage holin family protein [Clostridium perfringens]EJT6150469.1 phage holin family protein [Clostridium perfringens]EJT6156093.1 phage holin family protein [Clostridium perfringens]MDM0955568.1 phage holin family protein [Clostridium perfringens]MDU5651214.1 phage holin family protein [Clostridium perfringens]